MLIVIKYTVEKNESTINTFDQFQSFCILNIFL